MTKSTGAGCAPLVPTIANSMPDGVRSMVDWARRRGLTSVCALVGTTHAASRTSQNARRAFMKFLLRKGLPMYWSCVSPPSISCLPAAASAGPSFPHTAQNEVRSRPDIWSITTPGAHGPIAVRSWASGVRRCARRPKPSRHRRGGQARRCRLPGRMVRGYRLSLARLTVDLGPDDARLQRGGYQQVVDAHAKVLMEVAGAVVPPRVPPWFGMAQPVGVNESPAAQTCERLPFTLGDVRSAMAGARVPHIDVFGRHVEVAAEHDRRVGRRPPR